MPSIYIINPATSEPTYHTLDVLHDEGGGRVMVADLTIVSLAAFVPAGWDIRITDEAIAPVDLDAVVDFVAITGKVSQANRMIELAGEFRARGRTILIGGPFATLDPEAIRPHADVMVTGELEDIAVDFFADLAAGTWKSSYDGGKADLRRAPLPRWDLYPVERAQVGALQTTRGCPFTCEFCDVIQYQGRKQRHKDIDQILRELDALYLAGFRRTFLVDDNFTVHRSWARTVLQAIVDWNAQHDGDRMSFYTQVSLDVVRDQEMLELCHTAGFFMLFMGVETINEESLRETGKKQNLLTPMTEAMERVVRSGLAVHAGIIVGFDHDGPSIFDTMKDFMYDLPVPQLGIGVLTAPKSTDLYRRLRREGRLIEQRNVEIQGPFTTNIVPLRMSREELLEGTLELVQWAFAADNYRRRMMAFIDLFPEGGEQAKARRTITRPGDRTFFACIKAISDLGVAEAAMVQAVLRAAARKPLILQAVNYYLVLYAQTRYFLSRHSLADRTNRFLSEKRLQGTMSASA